MFNVDWFWIECRTSQLGYCIRESPKFHLISVKLATNLQETDQFTHRILQCPIQRYRMSLSSFDWNYFDENRLVLLGGKEYFDYVIPSRSYIVRLFFSFHQRWKFLQWIFLLFSVILDEMVFCGVMVEMFNHRSSIKINHKWHRKFFLPMIYQVLPMNDEVQHQHNPQPILKSLSTIRVSLFELFYLVNSNGFENRF